MQLRLHGRNGAFRAGTVSGAYSRPTMSEVTMGARHVDRGRSQSRMPVFAAGPAVLAVVGEHRADPTRLLLLGDDGVYYTYDDGSDDPIAIELSADWVVDIAHAA